MADAQLRAVISAEDQASKVIAGVGGSLGKVQDKLQSMQPAFKAMAAVGTVAFGALSAVVYKSVQAANESAQVQAQLAAVLKSTGQAAGVTAEMATRLATALQSDSTYSDEAILSAENLLLTFTNISKKVFPAATATVLDMSVALGQDLQSSAVQLGKALQDPIQGINALRRVGVNFTDDQKKVIENLVNTGHTLEAQRLILKELNTEFGGSAAAAVNTFAGRMAQLKIRVDDIQESIGKALIPVLEQVLARIVPVVEKIIQWADANPQLVVKIIAVTAAIAGLTATVGALGLTLPSIITGVQALGTALAFLATNPVGAVITVVGLLAAGLVFLYSRSEAFREAVQNLGQGIVTAVSQFNAFWNSSVLVKNIVDALKLTFDAVWLVVKANLFPAFQQLWVVVSSQLFPALQQLWAALQPLAPYFEMLAKIIGGTLIVILITFTAVLGGIVIAVAQVVTWIVKLQTALIDTLGAAIQKASGWIHGFAENFMEVVNVIDKAIGRVTAFIEKVSKINLNPFSSSFKLPSLPGRASGGAVNPNQPYLVGERGPELFTPSSYGQITRNGSLGDGGGITINVYGDVSGQELIDKVKRGIMSELKLNAQI